MSVCSNELEKFAIGIESEGDAEGGKNSNGINCRLTKGFWSGHWQTGPLQPRSAICSPCNKSDLL